MAQYEWVDVHSLKRWGDPSTEGTVDGIIGGGSGFSYNNNIDFTEGDMFYYYIDRGTSTNKSKAISDNKLSFQLEYSWSKSTGDRYASEGTTSTFVMCEEFDKFSKITSSTFKRVEISLTTTYANWAIYFVLEDGTIMGTDPYSQRASNLSLRLPIKKMSKVDTRFLGKFLMYPFQATSSNQYLYDFITGQQIGGSPVTETSEWYQPSSNKTGTTTTTTNKVNVAIYSIKFLNK